MADDPHIPHDDGDENDENDESDGDALIVPEPAEADANGA